jgi:hypothetical protein
MQIGWPGLQASAGELFPAGFRSSFDLFWSVQNGWKWFETNLMQEDSLLLFADEICDVVSVRWKLPDSDFF